MTSERLIAFDLDDTIYKERDFVLSGYRHICRTLSEKYGLPEGEMMHALTTAPLNPFESLEEYLVNRSVQRGDENAEDIRWMVDTYRRHFPDISPAPTVIPTLDELKRRGYLLAIITDGRRLTQTNKILALGLDNVVARDNISISEVIGAEKYTPIPFERMMKRWPDVKKYAYVGDNPMKDFVWPNRLGWETVQLRDDGRNVHPQTIEVPSDDYRPRRVIDRFEELLDLFP